MQHYYNLVFIGKQGSRKKHKELVSKVQLFSEDSQMVNLGSVIVLYMRLEAEVKSDS